MLKQPSLLDDALCSREDGETRQVAGRGLFGQGIECGLGSTPASIINYRIGSNGNGPLSLVSVGVARPSYVAATYKWAAPPLYPICRLAVGNSAGARCEDRTWGDGARAASRGCVEASPQLPKPRSADRQSGCPNSVLQLGKLLWRPPRVRGGGAAPTRFGASRGVLGLMRRG